MVNPRTLRIPLRWKLLATGFVALQAVVQVEVRTRHHLFERLEFIVDPGAGVSSFSVRLAEDRKIPFSADSTLLEVDSATGSRRLPVHAGRIVVRIPGFKGREFHWPCHFVELDAPSPKPLLGLGGILNDLRITFDGTYSVEAPHGWLVLEEVGP